MQIAASVTGVLIEEMKAMADSVCSPRQGGGDKSLSQTQHSGNSCEAVCDLDGSGDSRVIPFPPQGTRDRPNSHQERCGVCDATWSAG
jgi:hypothetical protein